ncbi:MAG: hypothetical protein WAO58_12265 [Fimbriimonadaceae bacterium]
MIIALILFWLLLVWGVYDAEIYAKEAAMYALIWAVCFTGFMTFPQFLVWFIAPLVLLPILLVIRLFGKDLIIR